MELAFTLALCLILLQLLRVCSSKKISIVEENVHAGLIRKNAAAASKERGGERERACVIFHLLLCALLLPTFQRTSINSTPTHRQGLISVCVCVSAPSVQLINFSWHPLLTTVGNRTQLKRVATSALWISLSLSLCVCYQLLHNFLYSYLLLPLFRLFIFIFMALFCTFSLWSKQFFIKFRYGSSRKLNVICSSS